MEQPNGTPKLEFSVMDGLTAQPFDPQGFKWPESSIVTIAHRGDQVVGRCALIEVPHIEGTWVAEVEQKSTIAYRMVSGAEKTLKHLGRSQVFAFVESDNKEMQDYAVRMGYKRQPLEVWVKEL